MQIGWRKLKFTHRSGAKERRTYILRQGARLWLWLYLLWRKYAGNEEILKISWESFFVVRNKILTQNIFGRLDNLVRKLEVSELFLEFFDSFRKVFNKLLKVSKNCRIEWPSPGIFPFKPERCRSFSIETVSFQQKLLTWKVNWFIRWQVVHTELCLVSGILNPFAT